MTAGFAALQAEQHPEQADRIFDLTDPTLRGLEWSLGKGLCREALENPRGEAGRLRVSRTVSVNWRTPGVLRDFPQRGAQVCRVEFDRDLERVALATYHEHRTEPREARFVIRILGLDGDEDRVGLLLGTEWNPEQEFPLMLGRTARKRGMVHRPPRDAGFSPDLSIAYVQLQSGPSLKWNSLEWDLEHNAPLREVPQLAVSPPDWRTPMTASTPDGRRRILAYRPPPNRRGNWHPGTLFFMDATPGGDRAIATMKVPGEVLDVGLSPDATRLGVALQRADGLVIQLWDTGFRAAAPSPEATTRDDAPTEPGP